VQLLGGLGLFGVGLGLMVRAVIGLAPWDVLNQGLALHTGLSFGTVVNLVGLVVLALWVPLRERPGVGTVLNVLLIGPAADGTLAVVPEGLPLPVRVALFAAGLLAVGVASGLYIGAGFGAGPRDGLMTGLHRITRWPVWVIRTGIEAAVLLVGWLLGGDVGFGTLAFALLIGPIVGWTIPRLTVRAPDACPAPAGDVSPAPAPPA
jgi:uncharacterized membrane protein YczE